VSTTPSGFVVGMIIRVLSSSERWRECTVVQYDEGDALLRVHYEGFSPRFDEWIDLDTHGSRVRQGLLDKELPVETVTSPLAQRMLCCPGTVALLKRTAYRASRSSATSKSGGLPDHIDPRCIEAAREELRQACLAGHARTSFYSRWGRLMVRRAAIIGRGAANVEWLNEKFSDELPQLPAVILSPKQGNWLEALCPRHRVGKNLEAYYYDWATCDKTVQSFFYWLDYGEGQKFENKRARRSKLETQTIEYCSEAQRERYAVTVRGGLVYYPGSITPIHHDRSMMFAMGTDLSWYMAPKIAKQFHHSSFLAGGVVVAVGMATVHHGVVRKVNTSSGHYRPVGVDLPKLVTVVQIHAGVDMSKCEVITDKSDIVQKEPTADYGREYWNLY
jgi:hypothetical protein